MSTILVVEDNLNQARLYEEELTDEGYAVVLADNGQEALRVFDETHPDLVVLDINMPGMCGLEVMERFLDQNPQVPVILHTAYFAYKDNFMSWAANSYVVKSSDLTNLKSHIREALTVPVTS